MTALSCASVVCLSKTTVGRASFFVLWSKYETDCRSVELRSSVPPKVKKVLSASLEYTAIGMCPAQ